MTLKLETGIPQQLTERRQWLPWKYASRHGKRTKIPCQPDGRPAKWKAPITWTDFATAAAVAERFDGVGYIFSADDPFFGVDLDACRDPDTGQLTDWAAEIVSDFGTYTEISPSKHGIKLVGIGTLAADHHVKKLADVPTFGAKSPEIAIYDRARFWCMTGNRLNAYPVEPIDCQRALDRLCARLWPPNSGMHHDGGGDSATRSGELSRVKRRMEGIRVDDQLDGSRRLLTCCCICVEHDLTDRDAIEAIRSYERLFPFPRREWSDAEITQRIRDAEKKTVRGKESSGASLSNGAPKTVPALASHQGRTDVANAKRLLAAFGSRVRYVAPWNTWLLWDGKRWGIDETCAVEKLAIQTLSQLWRQFANEAQKVKDAALHKQILAFVRRSQDRGRARDTLELVRPFVAVRPAELDADPYVFNVDNGTVDLRTGKLREHDPADLITKLSPATYDLDADCPNWKRFLGDVFAGDLELGRYVQRVAGYSMIGEVKEHILAFLYGTGSNGKSTLVETQLAVFGDYGMKCNADLLLAKKHDTHPTERADLHGKRLVVAVEADAGRQFAEALLKELTGGDRIRARRMRENFWEFSPSHTIWLAANHKPVVRGTDEGFWRRIKLIPFLQQWDTDGSKPHLPAADKELTAKLRSEMSGILMWMLLGLSNWQEHGIQTPEIVTAATQKYRFDSDLVGQFIDDCCVTGPHERCRSSQLFNAYAKWCEAGHIRPMSQTAFGREMQARGFEKQVSNGVFRVGISTKISSVWNSLE